MSPEIKNIIVLSDWLAFELETKLFDPPVIKLKLGPIAEGMAFMDVAYARKKAPTMGEIIAYKALEAVKEWDFTDKGKPVEVTRDNKEMILLPLLDLKIKGERTILGMKIFEYASNKENFLKNSKPVSAITKRSGTS